MPDYPYDEEFNYEDMPEAPPEEAILEGEELQRGPVITEIPAEPTAPDIRPAFDTRTPGELYAPENIQPAAATTEGEAPAKYLTNVPEKAEQAREQGYEVFFNQEASAEKKKEGPVGKFPEREGFKKYMVDRMFEGNDPEKINPVEIGEEARRAYLRSVMGGKPFYQLRGVSSKTLGAIQKEADLRAKEARDMALRIRQERLKTIDRYMQRFDQDYKPTNETMIWAMVNGKPERMSNRQIQEARRQGFDVRPYEKPAGGGKQTRIWATVDGVEGRYTDEELDKATQEGREVSQYRTPGQKIEARQKALKIAGQDFGGLTIVKAGNKEYPGYYEEKMDPGKLRRINEEFKIAGIPPLKEEAIEWRQWNKMFGSREKAEPRTIYKYTHEDGTTYGEEPGEVSAPKRRPGAPATPGATGVTDYGPHPTGGGRVDMEGYVVDWDKNKDPVKVIHKQSGLTLPVYKDSNGKYWVIDPNTRKPFPFIVNP